MDSDNSKLDRPPKWEDLPESTRRYIWWNVSLSKYFLSFKFFVGVIIVMLILLGAMILIIREGNKEMVFMSLQESRTRAVGGVVQQIRLYKIRTKVYPQSLDELIPAYLKELPVDRDGATVNFLYARSQDGNRFHLGTKLQIYEGGTFLSARSPHPLTYDSDFNSMTAGYLDGFNGADPVYDLEDGKWVP